MTFILLYDSDLVTLVINLTEIIIVGKLAEYQMFFYT